MDVIGPLLILLLLLYVAYLIFKWVFIVFAKGVYRFLDSVDKAVNPQIKKTVSDYSKSDLELNSESVECESKNQQNKDIVMDIPIEILPNNYALSLEHVSIMYHDHGNLKYMTVKGEVRYQYTGAKNKKCNILFIGYDEDDKVKDIQGKNTIYKINNTGCDVFEICFSNCYENNMIHRIGVLMKEQ